MKYTSKYAINDRAIVNYYSGQKLDCTIISVRFTEDKVYYDIQFDDSPKLYRELDSALFEDI
jgi:hypothetical protein